MKVILFGATGMVGQGVLRECLISPEIEFVLTVVLLLPGRVRGRHEPGGLHSHHL